MDNFLGLLGLSLRAGKLAMGETPVLEALTGRRARAVFFAQDASPHTRRKFAPKLENTPQSLLPYGKDTLGRALGRKSCAVVAVTDPGLARSLLEKLPSHHSITTTEVP